MLFAFSPVWGLCRSSQYQAMEEALYLMQVALDCNGSHGKGQVKIAKLALSEEGRLRVCFVS